MWCSLLHIVSGMNIDKETGRNEILHEKAFRFFRIQCRHLTAQWACRISNWIEIICYRSDAKNELFPYAALNSVWIMDHNFYSFFLISVHCFSVSFSSCFKNCCLQKPINIPPFWKSSRMFLNVCKIGDTTKTIYLHANYSINDIYTLYLSFINSFLPNWGFPLDNRQLRFIMHHMQMHTVSTWQRWMITILVSVRMGIMRYEI